MIIYKATNKVNGKIYIGLTVKSLAKRRAQHHHDAEKLNGQYAFHRAIRKYGRDGFDWNIVEKVNSTEELPMRETYWINHYGSFGKNGYNMTIGGEGTFGYKMSKESIEKSLKTKIMNNTLLKGSKIGTSKLTEDEVLKIKGMIKDNHSDGDISEIFNVSRTTISGIRRGLQWSHVGVDVSYIIASDTKYSVKFSEEDILEIKQMIKDNLPQSAIAEKFNTTQTTVSNIKMNKIYSHIGEDVSNYNTSMIRRAKLTEEEVREIRILLRDTNLKQKDIAKIYGVGKNLISEIKNYNIWKHVQIA